MAAAAATAATAASESLLSQSLADRLDKRFQLYERRYDHKALAARAAFGDLFPTIAQARRFTFWNDFAKLFIADNMNLRLTINQGDVDKTLELLDAAWIGADPSVLSRLVTEPPAKITNPSDFIEFLDLLHVIQHHLGSTYHMKSVLLLVVLSSLEDANLKEKWNGAVLRFFADHHALGIDDARPLLRKAFENAERVYRATRGEPTVIRFGNRSRPSSKPRYASSSGPTGASARTSGSGPRQTSRPRRRKKLMLPVELKSEFSGINSSDNTARRDFCNRHKLCFDCLGRGHPQSKCRTPFQGN